MMNGHGKRDTNDSPNAQPVSSVAVASSAAARGTVFAILLKIFSFILTQLTVRFVNPGVLGKASIRLELLLSSNLFLAREGFRLALTVRGSHENGANDGKNEHKEQKKEVGDAKDDGIINVAWISIPSGLALSLLTLGIHLFTCHRRGKLDGASSENILEEIDYRFAGILYVLAAAIETLSEPIVILNILRELDTSTRSFAEGFATLCKSVTCIILFGNLIYFGMEQQPVSVFGIGQLVYAFVLTGALYWRKWDVIRWPHLATRPWPCDGRTVRLTIIFTIQGMFKHALTEGDRIVLTALSGSYHQGTYALASAYGGIASRLLFAPLEDNARLLFARQHRMGTTKELRMTYCALVKLVLFVGLIFACVGSNYTAVLLRLFAGPRWGSSDEAVQVLSAYCVYTAFLALNGMTEAFVYGVAETGEQIRRLSVVHGSIGAVFCFAASMMVKSYGTVGLVAANCLSMALRSIYSVIFAASYFRNGSKEKESKSTPSLFSCISILTKDMLPSFGVLASFAVSYVATLSSSSHFSESVVIHDKYAQASKHVGIGAACICGILGTSVLSEHMFFNSIKNLSRGKLH